jgi:G:T-mismatch repair DNA endonuclease (very short patch repair protein)
MNKCEICAVEFNGTRRTCSKICKNSLARLITINQFSDPSAREVQRQKSIVQKQNADYQAKFKASIAKRTARWEETGHPRQGMQQTESAKLAIGAANKGRFKGKSWDEIFGKEVADRRRLENSVSMSKKNEVLLKEKRSSLEEKLLPYLPYYENNVQISYFNVDFVNKQTKHIIEVYGDYWHCNPIKYADDFMHHHFKMTAIERRKLDEDRIEHLKSLGYTVTIVWESDLAEFMETL